ncbi:MAG: tripartite tricarboxylate transporter TctB family protein [Rhizobiaceae bacterium]
MFKTLQDMFKRYRRPGDIVFSVLFLAISLFLVSQIGQQTVWKNGTKLFAQPSFWPSVSLITMSLFALLHLAGSVFSPRIEGRWGEVKFWLRSLEYVGWFLAYVSLVPILGYLIATVLFTMLLAYRLNYRTPKWLALSALSGIVIVVTFKTFLQVKVPGGAIYEYLPTAFRSFMLTNF